MTLDSGKEFAMHELLAELLDAKSDFAHHHSWERGLNENTNGLIRKYFAKGSSFDDLTCEEIAGRTFTQQPSGEMPRLPNTK